MPGELLTREPLAIQIHRTLSTAFFLGNWLIFFSTEGSRFQRARGLVYFLLITVAAAAIFIRGLRPGHMSWIYIFAPLTLLGVTNEVWRVRREDINRHRVAMMSVYFGGLIIAWALTFFPGRQMYPLFFE